MTKSTTSNVHPEEDTRGRPGYYDFHAPKPLTHDVRSPPRWHYPPPKTRVANHFPPQQQRVSSFPSTIASSTSSTTSSSSKRVASWLKPSVKPAPKVNVHTTCGRHTDQLLFGGPSLTDLARAVFKKNK